MFQPPENKSFAARETDVLHFWQEQGTFQHSIEARRNGPHFTIFDGPPFATGLPHYGHILAGTIKDVIPRYKTMKGFHVPRRFGWDCHGLPIENEIEKSEVLTGAASIEAYGIARFNEACRSIVLRYTSEWRSIVLRMGRWVDFDNNWKTMDLSYMDAVWGVFRALYDKKLVYQGLKVMPYSAKLGTPLSNFEASENYKDVDDPSLTVAFRVVDQPNTFLLIWTTTPWTLVSNMAVAVGKEIDYVRVRRGEATYIVAAARRAAYFDDADPIVEHLPGSALEGWQYEPPFAHFASMRERGAFRVIVDGFVTLEDGTGLVHCAPAFGEADFYACQARNIPVVCPVGQNGQFTHDVPEYSNRFVKDCDSDIIKRLKGEGKVFRHETCHHRYPFCWRSDTPLIYKAVTTWFVGVEQLRDKLLAANEQISWMPEHIKYGRFGKWLEGARDWAISRNRYWGTPIPVWQAEDGERLVVGSRQELEALTGRTITDLHRHHIDDIVIERNGKRFTRIPEVFDCWFESGSMPYATGVGVPGDFVAEGIDQTRAWFYTLTVLAAALHDKPAFHHAIVNGIVLAADGNKMSKRLRNYPDPMEVVNKYGADAVRLYLLSSPAVRADDLCFSEAGVEGVLRQVLLPLWNSYSFFVTYARLYNWEPTGSAPTVALDQWMISLLNTLVSDVTTAMERYDLNHAVGPLVAFIDQLTNWYIRRSRRRFWNDDATPDRESAFSTLYTVLTTLVQIAAPFVPFTTEGLYRNLRRESDPASVHLCDYPVANPALRNPELEASMAMAQRAVTLGHSLRKEHRLKVRQPLACAYLVTSDPIALARLQSQQELIADELNVQAVVCSANEHEYARYRARPNFRVLGKKVGKLMREVQALVDALPQADVDALVAGRTVPLALPSGETIDLTPDDVTLQREIREDMIAAHDETLIVALDTHLTPELISLGFAREFVNRVNTLRKEQGFDISDRVHIVVQTTSDVQHSLQQHEPFIAGEVLALSIAYGACEGTDSDLNGIPTTIALQRVAR